MILEYSGNFLKSCLESAKSRHLMIAWPRVTWHRIPSVGNIGRYRQRWRIKQVKYANLYTDMLFLVVQSVCFVRTFHTYVYRSSSISPNGEHFPTETSQCCFFISFLSLCYGQNIPVKSAKWSFKLVVKAIYFKRPSGDFPSCSCFSCLPVERLQVDAKICIHPDQCTWSR